MFLLLFTACIMSTQGPIGPKIKWLTLSRGKEMALASEKPCLVDFYYGKGCGRCEKIDEEVYNDPQVAARINSRFVPIRINIAAPLAPEEKELADRMKSGGECLLMFLDHRGKVVRRSNGPPLCTLETIGREQFIAILDEAEKALEVKK